ncbi:hypothetical protein JYT83_00590 [bacterium AH-315-F18]|nr:hypothetical protein [bacterium AH-315-F18]
MMTQRILLLGLALAFLAQGGGPLMAGDGEAKKPAPKPRELRIETWEVQRAAEKKSAHISLKGVSGLPRGVVLTVRVLFNKHPGPRFLVPVRDHSFSLERDLPEKKVMAGHYAVHVSVEASEQSPRMRKAFPKLKLPKPAMKRIQVGTKKDALIAHKAVRKKFNRQVERLYALAKRLKDVSKQLDQAAGKGANEFTATYDRLIQKSWLKELRRLKTGPKQIAANHFAHGFGDLPQLCQTLAELYETLLAHRMAPICRRHKVPYPRSLKRTGPVKEAMTKNHISQQREKIRKLLRRSLN